jgi:hypothetical protein
MATRTERAVPDTLAAQQQRISESRLLGQHERLSHLAATLAKSVNRWGEAVSEAPALDERPRGTLSRHSLSSRVSLAALSAFADGARAVDPAREVLVGDRSRMIVLSVLPPPLAPALEGAPSGAPSRAPASRKRGRDTVAERVDRAVASMAVVPSVALPEEHRAQARDAVRALTELRTEGGTAPLESFALQLRDAPAPLGGAAPRHVLLLSARLAPGSVVRLARLLACLPEPRDGYLECSNDDAMGNHQLPLGAHARVGVELGLTTLQLACSVGAPFEERAPTP